MTKLNLGCGRKRMYGFTNVDIRPAVEPDVVDDVFQLRTFDCGSVELIFACHVLEHAERDAVESILARWHAVLKPGGILRVCVPDLRAACEYYLATHDLRAIHGLLYGGQRNEWDFHRVGFDEVTLGAALKGAGFTGVRTYDWRETEHSFVDDYSAAHLPRLSYFTRNPSGTIEGKPVSLNMEATK